MKSQKRIIVLISLIVLIDQLTKLLALYALPFHENVFLIGDKLSFYLTYNEGSTGGQAGYLLEQEINKNLTLVLNSIAAFILIGYVLTIKERKMKKLFKWLLGIGIYITTVIALELVKPNLTLEINNWTASLISKIAGISFYLTILTLVSSEQLRLFIWVVISAGLGNLVSHFYYPYKIVDFISVEGSYKLLRIGVFNFADIMFDAGIIGIFVILVALIIKKIRAKRLTTIDKKT